MTKIEALGERLDAITNRGNSPDLTTEEGNLVREFWIQLHWTDDEAKEYFDAEKRQDEIHAAAGSVYLNSEQNREYMRLATRQTELIHDIRGKRVGVNHVMRDRVWPMLVPRALRYWKLIEKPREQLADAEAQELRNLTEWFSKLQAEALEASRQALESTKMSDRR